MDAFRQAQREARVRSSGIGIPAHPSNALPRSGVQPDASGQVLCPFCHKGYRFSPALLNRQLRCSGCRAIFRVAEDRRSFRVQAASGGPSKAANETATYAKRAIKEANSSLNQAAAEALRAISRHERPAPPGSETGLHAARPASDPAAPAAQQAAAPKAQTRVFRRKGGGPLLTGEGESAGRLRHRLLVGAAIVLALAVLVAVAVRPDDRARSLAEFERTLNWNTLEQLRRDGAFQGQIAAITGISTASLAGTQRLDLSALRQALEGMRVLVRGQLWVERARHGEAVAMLTPADQESPKAIAAFLQRCAKLNLRTRTWAEVLAEAEAGQPAVAAGVMRSLLSPAAPAGPGFDPVALLDAGRLPAAIEISAFQGRDGGRMIAGKPPQRPYAYQGRLLRFRGDGWPTGWRVYELQPAGP